MELTQTIRNQLTSDVRRVLLIGSKAVDAATELCAAAQHCETWIVRSCALTGRPALLRREISGDLLTLPVGTLPLRVFDLIAVSGDLPFGTRLQEFMGRLAKLISPQGRLCVEVPNSLSASRLALRLAGGFELEPSGSFTPMEAKCALAQANFRIVAEELRKDPQTAAEDVTSLASVLWVASPAVPAVDPTRKLSDALPSTRASIIVLTYNSASTIEALLKSVLASVGKADEVIVVDNASSDATVELVKAFAHDSQQVRLLRNSQNLGFSAGCNVGIRASKGALVSLLNPDTTVWPGWIESLAARLHDPTVGMVGPVSDRIAGLQFVGHYVSRPQEPQNFDEFAAFCAQQFRGQYLDTKLLIGLCVMLRRVDLQRVGLLDENLFLGSDDLELSWRLRTHGLRLLVSKAAFVQHLGGVSFSSLDQSEKKRLLHESTEALLAKIRAHYGWLPPDAFLWGLKITHQ